MTAREIIDAFCISRTKNVSGNLVFPNTYLNRNEADIFEISKSGYLTEYEVKISKSDFKADFKKKKKISTILEGQRCNYFYYLVPKGLIDINELPDYAGLIEIDHFFFSDFRKISNYDLTPDFKCPSIRTTLIKPSKKLSNEKLGDINKDKLMLSTYHRYHNKVVWERYKYE